MFRGRPYRPDEVPGSEAVLRADGHWSTEKLVGYWPMLEGAGKTTRNYARENHGEIRGNAGWGAGEHGWAAAVDAGGSGFDSNMWVVPKTPELSFRTTDEFTFGSVWRASVLHDGHPIVSRNAPNPFVWWRVLSDGRNYCTVNQTQYTYALVVFSYAAGTTYTSLGAWQPATNTLTAIQNNEIKSTTQALNNVECTSGDYWATRNQEHNWNGSTKRPFQGLVFAQVIWRRALNETELREFHPYLPLWRPARVRIFDMGSKARHRLWYPGFSAPSFGPWT